MEQFTISDEVAIMPISKVLDKLADDGLEVTSTSRKKALGTDRFGIKYLTVILIRVNELGSDLSMFDIADYAKKCGYKVVFPHNLLRFLASYEPSPPNKSVLCITDPHVNFMSPSIELMSTVHEGSDSYSIMSWSVDLSYKPHPNCILVFMKDNDHIL